ncbi:MAG TPA: Flp family type IVb pilin [Firmicutes bacterium]|nr:Flp family type IVb pilin [Candidatus Fermentithermobacillaceae bacterium]
MWLDKALSDVLKTWADEQGATVAEYALILVLIAVALITVLGDLGRALQDRIQEVIMKLPATP